MATSCWMKPCTRTGQSRKARRQQNALVEAAVLQTVPIKLKPIKDILLLMGKSTFLSKKFRSATVRSCALWGDVVPLMRLRRHLADINVMHVDASGNSGV